MNLTGKCKEDFEKWYNEVFIAIKQSGQSVCITDKSRMNLSRFYYLKEPMQYGVYVDFFDSVGVFVSDKWNHYNVDKGIITEWGSHLWTKENGDMNIRNKISRPEARTKAIEKANNIYNDRTTN